MCAVPIVGPVPLYSTSCEPISGGVVAGSVANTGVAQTDTAREAARSRAAAFFVNFIIFVRQWGPRLTVSLGSAYSFHIVWFVDPQFSSFLLSTLPVLPTTEGSAHGQCQLYDAAVGLGGAVRKIGLAHHIGRVLAGGKGAGHLHLLHIQPRRYKAGLEQQFVAVL